MFIRVYSGGLAGAGGLFSTTSSLWWRVCLTGSHLTQLSPLGSLALIKIGEVFIIGAVARDKFTEGAGGRSRAATGIAGRISLADQQIEQSLPLTAMESVNALRDSWVAGSICYFIICWCSVETVHQS